MNDLYYWLSLCNSMQCEVTIKGERTLVEILFAKQRHFQTTYLKIVKRQTDTYLCRSLNIVLKENNIFVKMKLLTLHRRNTHINYKHSVCSLAAAFVLLAALLSILLPFYIAFYLYNDLWSQYKIIYEQPNVIFHHKYIFVAEHMAIGNDDATQTNTKITACNSFKYLNEALNNHPECAIIKVMKACVTLPLMTYSECSIHFTVLGKRY